MASRWPSCPTPQARAWVWKIPITWPTCGGCSNCRRRDARACSRYSRATRIARTGPSASESECGQYRAAVGFLYERLDLGRGQGRGQLLHARIVLVVGARDEEVHVWRILVLDQQCILHRIQLGGQRVVGIDECKIDLAE